MQKTVGTKWTLERGERELPRAELFRGGYFVKNSWIDMHCSKFKT